MPSSHCQRMFSLPGLSPSAMFSRWLESFSSYSTKRDKKRNNIGEKRRRLGEEEQDEDVIITDVLQTPPSKRIKNYKQVIAEEERLSSISQVFSDLLHKAMSWADKYNNWKSATERDSSKHASTTKLSTDLGNAEDEVTCIDVRPNKQTVSCHVVQSTDTSRHHSARDSMLKTRPQDLASCSFTQTSTPARHYTGRSQPPVFKIPTQPQEPWQHRTYIDRYKDASQKPTHKPREHCQRMTRPPVPTTSQQISISDTNNTSGQESFTIGHHLTATKHQGKVKIGKQLVRRPVNIHRHKSTVEGVVRLQEKEIYKQLLSQFTCTTLTDGTVTDISTKDKENVSACQSSVFEATIALTHRRQARSPEGSVLSPRSSLLPSKGTTHLNMPSSPMHPTPVWKVMPSPTKLKERTTHVEDLPPLYSKPGPAAKAISQNSTLPSRTPKAIKEPTECPLLDDWTKKWRNVLSSENMSREREMSRIAREEEKVKAFRDKRKEEEDHAIQEVLERIRREEEGDSDDEYEGEDEVSFVLLTEDMEQRVDTALAPGNPSDNLAEGFKVNITRGDLATLSNLNWLNDEVINFYFSLLTERSNGAGFPKVYSFNSFFYPKLIRSGYASLKRWTRKVDVLAVDIILVPIHLGMHWCVAAIDFRNKTITYYDSLKGSNSQCLDALSKYLKEESMDKKKKPFDVKGWKSACPKDIPEQLNGCDCGVFACKYAEYISRDAKFNFDQNNMPYFRRRMVYEILTKKLL